MRRSPASSSEASAPRILLYSHDSFGIGHLSRSLTIARFLVDSLPGASAVIATGSPCATRFPATDGIDVVKLPSVSKDGTGRYVPRSLPLALDAVIAMRRSLLLELYRAYRPHLLVVDHKVTGLAGELLPVLRAARPNGTRTILGLRDIIDAPSSVASEWRHAEVQRSFTEDFDRICIYGWPTVFDPRVEYALPEGVAERVEFTGYVVRPRIARPWKALPGPRPRVVVTVGGGEDGAKHLETYLAGLELGQVEWDTTLVSGPLLETREARRIERRARQIEHVDVRPFHSELPRVLQGASAVVSMAGYNTAAEILSSHVPSVLLPRVWPRAEQLIRAERLQRRGLAQCLRSPTPGTLRASVERALVAEPARGERPPLDGTAAITRVASELLGMETPVREEACVQ
ncbi:MAG: hypothetical protein GY711_07340 [bacterium]|nr:hypothetical protein [bacterium]